MFNLPPRYCFDPDERALRLRYEFPVIPQDPEMLMNQIRLMNAVARYIIQRSLLDRPQRLLPPC